jgi:aspartate-semialdehyde dehydrogenase
LSRGIALAVLGAAGLRGENLLDALSESSLPYGSLRLLDDDSQLGRKMVVGDRMVPLESYAQAGFSDIDLVLACEPVSAEMMELVSDAGATLVSLHAGLHESVEEAVIAELNLDRFSLQKGAALAVPSAESTVMARLLSPLHNELGLLSVQSHWVRCVSSMGKGAVESLAGETAQLLNGKRPKAGLLGEPIAFNLLALNTETETQAFRNLWLQLWGDDRLAFSHQAVLAPLFFGDIVSISLETEQASGIGELSEIFQSIDDIEFFIADPVRQLSVAASKDSHHMHLGWLRQNDDQGRRFSFQVALDTVHSGFTRNLLKISDSLVKNLFMSYS